MKLLSVVPSVVVFQRTLLSILFLAEMSRWFIMIVH